MKTVEEWIRVPKGSREGEEISIKGKGHESFNGSSGNLILEIKLSDDTIFSRKGDDVSSEHEISILDAVLGVKTTVKTL